MRQKYIQHAVVCQHVAVGDAILLLAEQEPGNRCGRRHEESWLRPSEAVVARERNPHFGTVIAVEAASGAPLVMQGDNGFAVGELLDHRRRVGMDEGRRKSLRPRSAIVLTAKLPDMPLYRA